MADFLIFDIGSNATKASLVTGSLEFVRDWRVSTKLGRHIRADGCMDLDAVRENICAVLSILHEASPDAVAPGHHCIGTEAVRRSANMADIVDLFARAGLHLEVLSAAREAELERIGIMHSGAARALPGRPFLLIDSGGSSTECSLMRADGSVGYSESFPFGQHRLIDMIHGLASDVHLEMMAALARELLREPVSHIVAAGSSFTMYALETLGMHNVRDVEGRRVPARSPVTGDAANAGRVLVDALDACLGLPVYVSTFGIRHGWIFEHFSG